MSRDEPSVTLLLKMSPPSFVEVLITALFAQLGERPAWRAPCVGLFRHAPLRDDAVKAFADLAANLRIDAEELLLAHYMRERAPPTLLAFRRDERASMTIGPAAPATGQALVRVESPTGTSELDVDDALVPLCRWIATAGPRAMTVADARAHAGGAGDREVGDLLAALEGAGLLEAVVEAPPRPRAVRRASKR